MTLLEALQVPPREEEPDFGKMWYGLPEEIRDSIIATCEDLEVNTVSTAFLSGLRAGLVMGEAGGPTPNTPPFDLERTLKDGDRTNEDAAIAEEVVRQWTALAQDTRKQIIAGVAREFLGAEVETVITTLITIGLIAGKNGAQRA